MSDIIKEINGTTMNITMGKDLNSKNAPELTEIINESAKDVMEINFDFSKLEYLTSAGLRSILTALQEMDEKGGKMTISHVCPNVMDIFRMTGFLNILTILD